MLIILYISKGQMRTDENRREQMRMGKNGKKYRDGWRRLASTN